MKKISLISFALAVVCFAISMIFVLLINNRRIGIAMCVAGVVCTVLHFIFKLKSEKQN